MVNRILALALVLATAGTIPQSQDSWETFNSIVLESTTSIPPMTVTLNPPATGTPYSLTFPGSLPTGDNTRRYSFSRAAGGTDGGLSWYATPYGATNQVAFFETDEELIGSNDFQWIDAAKQLSLNSTYSGSQLNMTHTVDVMGDMSSIELNATYSRSNTGAANASLLDLNVDATAMKKGSTIRGLSIDIDHAKSESTNSVKTVATGLYIDVTGGDTNRAAVLQGGFVGVNTEYPKVYMDIAGDVAFREFNYTGSNLPNGGHNVDFDGNGNRHSFIRIGSALSGQGEITGFAGRYSGKMLKIYNASGQVLTVKHLNGSSSAASQVSTSSNADLLLLPGNMYEFL